jgi:hypothetical protein
MILDASPSARSIIVSNIIYLVINVIQLFREIEREKGYINNNQQNNAIIKSQ